MNLVRVKTVAKYLRYHYDTVYGLIERREIPPQCVLRLPQGDNRVDGSKSHIRVDMDILEPWIKQEMMKNLTLEV